MKKRTFPIPRVTDGLRGLRDGFGEFAGTEVAGSVALLAAAVLGLVIANSPAHALLPAVFDGRLFAGAGPLSSVATLRGMIDNGAMALFFFVIGLEVKREIVAGELSVPRRAVLPALAALGGMAVPALIYLSLNPSGPAMRGWGVPMATDIAFVLGALALLGRRVPGGLKVFLTALAIADDIGAIVVIALFYTGSVSIPWLAGAAAALLGLLALGRMRRRPVVAYLVLGGLAWFAMLGSGVHPTIAGVLVALTVPARAGLRRAPALGPSPLQRLERFLHPFTTFAVLPLFALANASVRFAGLDLRSIALQPVTLGICAGLLLGKPLGIVAMSFASVRSGVADLPRGTGWRTLAGGGMLGGIGFTMALFIADLAFTDPALLAQAKLAVLASSLVAGVTGYAYLRRQRRGALRAL